MKRVYERQAPIRVRRQWVVGLCLVLVACVAIPISVKLLMPGSNWIRSSRRLVEALGLASVAPGVQVLATFWGLLVLLFVSFFFGHPGWLRRRYARCEVEAEAGTLRFTLASTNWPGSKADRQDPPETEELALESARAWPTRFGLRVEPRAERSRWQRWSRPLLIPLAEDDHDDPLVRRLLEGAGHELTSTDDAQPSA